jgi:hypothetical protein
MPTKYVVFQPADDTYLKNYIGQEADPQPIFGLLAEAYEYDTLAEVEEIALRINRGTVGTRKPEA